MTEGIRTRAIVSDATPDPVWDKFVETAPGGDHVQSSGWASTKRAQGLAGWRIVIERNGWIVAGAQVLIKPMSIVGGIGYVPRGPVVSDGETEAAGLVVEELKRLARRRRIRHLVVQPGQNRNWIAEELVAHGFRPSALSVAPTASILIDLHADIDDLYARLGKSLRKHIRRGRREGVEIREGDVEDVATFHALMSTTSARHGFTPYPREYFEAMWQALRPQGHIRLFLAEYHQQVVSAHLVVPFGERFLSKASAWSGEHTRVYPNDVLEWHLIEWAKAHGFRYYDMEGVDRETAERMMVDPTTKPRRTADAFKLKFGGDVVLLPKAFDYFPNPLVASTYGRVYRRLTSADWPRPVIAGLRTRTWARRGRT